MALIMTQHNLRDHAIALITSYDERGARRLRPAPYAAVRSLWRSERNNSLLSPATSPFSRVRDSTTKIRSVPAGPVIFRQSFFGIRTATPGISRLVSGCRDCQAPLEPWPSV